MFAIGTLILFFVTLGLYAPTFFYSFVFDDRAFIVENPFIKSFDHIFQNFNSGFPFTRMVSLASFALNYAMYGLNPFGFHVFNVIIHFAATMSIGWLARLLLIHMPIHQGIIKTQEEQKRLAWLAFFIALLFCVHPVQVQAVAYISQRFASQATLFYVLSLCFYIQARMSLNLRCAWPSFVSFGFFGLLAIMSKEEAVSLPLMVMAVEMFFFSKMKSFFTRNNILILSIGLLVFSVVFIKLFNSNTLSLFTSKTPSDSHEGDVFTLGTYLLTQIKVAVTFLRLLIWPFPQCLDYDYPMVKSFFEIGIILRAFFIGGLCYLAFRLRKQLPLVTFGLGWMLITFTANLVPRANPLWEHKLYLISFGFILALVMFLNHWIRSFKVLCGVLVILAIVLSGATFVRHQVFKNQMTLFEDTIKHSPNKWRVIATLAMNYKEVGRYSEAEKLFLRVDKVSPKNPLAWRDLGDFYFDTGSFEKAIVVYNQTIKLGTDDMEIRHRLGQSYENMGNLRRALWIYTRAMIVDVKSLVWRSDVYLKLGNLEQAQKDVLSVLKVQPDDVPALLGLAHVYEAKGDWTNALELLNQCILLNPASEMVYIERGLFLYGKDQEKARLDFFKAYQLNPYSSKLKAAFRSLQL